MVDPFFISRCGHWMSVLPATHPSFRRPSITASSKTTGWNFTNLHWIDRSPFKLVQRFQLQAESWLPCQPKGNTLKSCQKLLVRFQKNPWDTLYQCCSNYLTVLKIRPPGGVTSFSMSILMKLYLFFFYLK